ncbi:Uncharacterised protein [Vibrio cholerae]|nr:Uncharacterised protein [Vibrio cholerae]CSB43872.1 Uncharacterised protein [Vibrio cholerae]CSD51439.1 Uncharacterised protein [Vibrio cholerae]
MLSSCSHLLNTCCHFINCCGNLLCFCLLFTGQYIGLFDVMKQIIGKLIQLI